MGLFDALFGKPTESKCATPLVTKGSPDAKDEVFQDVIDTNTAWRYYHSTIKTIEDAGRQLADAPPSSFLLWISHTASCNLLHISTRSEIGDITNTTIGVVFPAFHVVLPCNPLTEPHEPCSMCIPIPDLDSYLSTHLPFATVGLRIEQNIRIFERAHWLLKSPVYSSNSLQLYLRREDVFPFLRFVQLSTSTVVVCDIQPNSAADLSGVRPGFRLIHLNGVPVKSVHDIWHRLKDPSIPFASLHFDFEPRLNNDVYQVTLHATDDIFDLSQCGLKFRRIFDMVFVTDSTKYGRHCGVVRGSCVLSVNGTRVPFMSFEHLTEFIASSAQFRLPLTLDLLQYDQDALLIDTERFLMTASLSVYHMVKATEQLRLLFLTLHSAILVPLGFSDQHDTCALAALGPVVRGAVLPFLATTRGPTPADMARLAKALKTRFRQIVGLGPVLVQFTCIVLFTLCFVEDKVVHREVTWAFRDFVKIIPLDMLLFYAAPLITMMKTSSKTMVRLSSIGILAEFIQRVHKKTLTFDEAERMPGIVDMVELRWQHQMLEAGILFAELSTDNDPSVSCAARQYLPSMMSELMHFNMNWAWMVPLVEVLSKALMPDGRLDALHLCFQLANEPTSSYWRMRLTAIFASLANDGNDSIRKVAAQKFVEFVTKVNIKELADAYDAASHASHVENNFSPKSSSCLVMSDIKESHLVSGSFAGSTDSNVSEVRRRFISLDIVEAPSTEDNMHILFALLDAYTNLMQDAPMEIQKIACRGLGQVASLFGREILCKFLIPTLQDVIVTDSDDCKCHGSSAVYDSVHHILARELCCLAPLLANDPAVVVSEILPFVTKLLTNVNHSHIVVEVLENFDALGFALGKSLFLQHLAPPLLNLVASNEWKLRVALAYNLAPLVRWLGIDEFMAQFKTVIETLSHDVVFQVRQLALDAWIVIFELQAEQTWRHHALAFIANLSQDANYQLRVSCIHFYAAVSAMLHDDEITESVVPTLIRFSQDPIPNVRVVCARELPKFHLPEGSRDELVSLLGNDTDPDVAFFAVELRKSESEE
ncbi:unnamed protein product [Aphanomyces euteiches]|uniref:PDZ domain-containing protein n=1 Tax=Aphanomyces euteiches TaxID=100861 RepID=A0A6G0XQ32_9STRA|nr:hypothetical protein Ae201684_002509 [Aphanomyces euteiches]KAH9138183.1 hypothetical protein AeRB84_017462 [Aphanomyces euteiches]